MADTFVTQVKVAGLVTENQVSFNAGKNKKIEENDTVTLFRDVDVIDPDTKERLGGVEVARLKLRVFLVSEKYCVASVVDIVPLAAMVDPVRVRRTKTVTLDPDEESPSRVLVTVGERASVRRPEPEPDLF